MLRKTREFLIRQPGLPADGSQQRPQRNPSFLQDRFLQDGTYLGLGAATVPDCPHTQNPMNLAGQIADGQSGHSLLLLMPSIKAF